MTFHAVWRVLWRDSGDYYADKSADNGRDTADIIFTLLSSPATANQDLKHVLMYGINWSDTDHNGNLWKSLILVMKCLPA